MIYLSTFSGSFFTFCYNDDSVGKNNAYESPLRMQSILLYLSQIAFTDVKCRAATAGKIVWYRLPVLDC